MKSPEEMEGEIRRVENDEHFAEIRDRIRAQLEDGGPAPRPGAGLGGQPAQVLRSLARDLRERCSAIGQMPLGPATLRGRVGALLVGLVRRALFWYTPRVVEMHHLTAAALAEIVNLLEQTGAALEQSRAANAELGAKCEELAGHCRHLDHEIEVRRRREAALLHEFRTQMAGQAEPARELHRELQQLRADQMAAAAEAVAHAGHPALEALYVSLQDDFRGTREEIKDRLQTYLPLLAEAGAGKAARILDLGCGRGEWLELLGEQSLNASGVDSNQEMVRLCRELNLDVAEGDAIAYLRALPPASAGTVTGFHVLEHLGLTEVLNLLDEVLRVLIPGGLAIFETPNPESVSVSTHTFYLDPTHHHPLPALLSRFLLEARGYSGVEIRYLHPCSPEQLIEDSGSEVVRRFNQQFYGPRDYAVIGRKPGPVATAPCES